MEPNQCLGWPYDRKNPDLSRFSVKCRKGKHLKKNPDLSHPPQPKGSSTLIGINKNAYISIIFKVKRMKRGTMIALRKHFNHARFEEIPFICWVLGIFTKFELFKKIAKNVIFKVKGMKLSTMIYLRKHFSHANFEEDPLIRWVLDFLKKYFSFLKMQKTSFLKI